MTRYEVADGVATITFDNIENRNALTAGFFNRLGDGLRQAAEDDSVRLIVLTNEGPAFCAGADLSGKRGEEEARYTLPQVFELMMEGPKPVVGRIAGHCMGGGVGLAAACDVSFAGDDVKFGFTEVRIGVAPAMISVVCLPKMRPADANELFLSGERISARRAAEVGLINRALPAAGLDAAVNELIGKLRAGGPNALAASKQLLVQVPRMKRDKAFKWTSKLSAELFASEEAAAGMAAFREKALPPWAT